MSTMVEADRAISTKRKIFAMIKLYTSFIGERRKNDQIIID